MRPCALSSKGPGSRGQLADGPVLPLLVTSRLVGVLLGRSQSERANDLEVAHRDQTRASCRGPVELVNHAAKTIQTSDAGRSPANVQHGSAVDHRWRHKLKALVWPLVVGVLEVLVEDPLRVTATQAQQPVQALLPYGSSPSLGDRACVRRLDGRLDDLVPSEAKTSSKARVNLLSRSQMRNPGPPAPARFIGSSRARWSIQGPFGWSVTPASRTLRVGSSMSNKT
jgi:hypothetical protein